MLTRKEMTPGMLTRFAIQSAFVGLGFSGLSTFISDFNASVDAASRVFKLIDENRRTVKESSDKIVSFQMDPAATPPNSDGISFQLESVSFSYMSRPEVVILRNISLSVPASSIVAIVGPSGSGKSTLMALMCGLFKAISGNIQINGMSIQNVDIEILRRTVNIFAWFISIYYSYLHYDV